MIRNEDMLHCETTIVKCFAQRHKWHNQDLNPHSCVLATASWVLEHLATTRYLQGTSRQGMSFGSARLFCDQQQMFVLASFMKQGTSLYCDSCLKFPIRNSHFPCVFWPTDKEYKYSFKWWISQENLLELIIPKKQRGKRRHTFQEKYFEIAEQKQSVCIKKENKMIW